MLEFIGAIAGTVSHIVPFSTACQRAVTSLTRVLETRYKGRYQLRVIDIRVNPAVTIEKNIYAVPLLEREQPSPARRLLGDMLTQPLWKSS